MLPILKVSLPTREKEGRKKGRGGRESDDEEKEMKGGRKGRWEMGMDGPSGRCSTVVGDECSELVSVGREREGRRN